MPFDFLDLVACTAPCSECMTTATTCTACTGTLFENSNACHGKC